MGQTPPTQETIWPVIQLDYIYVLKDLVGAGYSIPTGLDHFKTDKSFDIVSGILGSKIDRFVSPFFIINSWFNYMYMCKNKFCFCLKLMHGVLLECVVRISFRVPRENSSLDHFWICIPYFQDFGFFFSPGRSFAWLVSVGG